MHKSISELTGLLRERQISATELTDSALKQISSDNKKINAVVFVDEADAKARAEAADKKIAAGENQPLLGIPFSVKDLFNVQNQPTTAGSKILQGYIAPYTATSVQNLLNAGAVVVGRNNQDEFGMGSRNTYSHYGMSTNPWSSSHSPGGSSGGSAGAVSASMSTFSIGTDTGGSVRQPAHFCGVVGAKPTYGRISRFGIIAFASSLDQAGPLTKSVEDSALVLENICGFDPKDATSSRNQVPNWSKNLSPDMKGKRVGFCPSIFKKGIHPETEAKLDQALKAFHEAGA
ncbi:MAG: amidase, partial [Pseudomonadota bacterium]